MQMLSYSLKAKFICFLSSYTYIMSEPNKYLVVVFKKENNVDVVPTTWTFVKDGGLFSYWPRVKQLEDAHLAARDEDPPNKKTWAKYQIRVLKRFGDYQTAVDSIEHYLAHSDYQESESSQHTSFNATPVSRNDKTGNVKTIGRNLSKESDFAVPEPPPALLNAVRSAPSSSIASHRTSNSGSPVPLGQPISAMSFPVDESLDSSVQGPSVATPNYIQFRTEIDVASPAAGEILDISNSYMTLNDNPIGNSTAVHCEGICEEFWKTHKRFHSNILSILEKISSSQAILNRKLDEVAEQVEKLKTGQGRERDQTLYAFRSMLPFKASEDLLQFSDSLKADEAKRKSFVKFLAAIGGKDINDACYGILKRLMTDDVALNFSFLGTALKRSFQALEMNSVVFDALQSNKQLGASEKDIRERIMQFLHHANDRLKSRRKGPNKKSQENQDGQSEGSRSS